MKRVQPWMLLLPLVAGGILWFWLWHGYADGLRQDVTGWLSPGATIDSGGFPYRLEAEIGNADIRRQSEALEMHLHAATAVVNRAPWENDRQVIALIRPEATLDARHLAGARLHIAAPEARASLRTKDGHIARLSVIWTAPAITSGLFGAPITAERLETHVRETPAHGNIGPDPTGPVQAEVEVSGSGVRIGKGAPLNLELAAAVTADAPLTSFAGWATGGTIEIGPAILSDSSGEVARLRATLVPDGLGGLRIAGTIETVCPANVRAAFTPTPAAEPVPPAEQRLRRPARIAFAGTLPGGVTMDADNPAGSAGNPNPAGSAGNPNPAGPAGPVRAQLPPCPAIR